MSTSDPAPPLEGGVALDLSSMVKGVREVVPTPHGPLDVTVVGDRSLSPCVALPEAGLSAAACFGPLLAAAGPGSLLRRRFYFLLVELPGCGRGPDAPPPPPEAPPPSDETLAAQVAALAAHLGLREALGLGCGLGGAALLRFAADHPRALCGLVLVSPAAARAGWWEWAWGRAAAGALWYRGWQPWVVDHLAARLFGAATQALFAGGLGDSELVAAFRRDAAATPPRAARAALLAALSRGGAAALAPRLRCRVLLVVGADAVYRSDCMALAAAADKSRFALVEVEGAGVAAAAERPAELLSPLQLFLTALQQEGYALGPAGIVGE